MSDSPDIAAPPSASSNWRLVLRLGVGVLLVAGMLWGCSAMRLQKSRKQAAARQAVQQAGGVVYLDYQWRNGRRIPDGQPTEATWLRNLLGDAFFDRVVAVDLRRVEELGKVLDALRLLPYLTELNFQDTPLDDSILKEICRLRTVKRLDLSGTAVTDEGIFHLRNLGGLVHLSLARTAVSDQSKSSLMTLQQLKYLDLSATAVSQKTATAIRAALPRCDVVPP
jgi:hypothetical protein